MSYGSRSELLNIFLRNHDPFTFIMIKVTVIPISPEPPNGKKYRFSFLIFIFKYSFIIKFNP